MIPVIGVFANILSKSVVVLTLAGTAGMGYGLGRKYGRIACEMIDKAEEKTVAFVHAQAKNNE